MIACIFNTRKTCFVQAKAVHREKDIIGLEFILLVKFEMNFFTEASAEFVMEVQELPMTWKVN